MHCIRLLLPCPPSAGMMNSGGLQGLRVLAQTLLELPAASAICCQSSRASAAYHSSAVGILAISQSRRHLSSMPQTTCSNSALASTSAYAAFSTSTTGHAAQEQQCQSATSAPGESCARTATLLEVANALHGASSCCMPWHGKVKDSANALLAPMPLHAFLDTMYR